MSLQDFKELLLVIEYYYTTPENKKLQSYRGRSMYNVVLTLPLPTNMDIKGFADDIVVRLATRKIIKVFVGVASEAILKVDQ